ncbi:S9 family peptidase [Ktedonosporobacter rubrisoli]|uniref:prolyl oligopeptidase n=1 Tax=Ktedonosporobacter rubrisoli TaxID=2509675 RepID=A0A4P6JY09_KTERU|nr:prolyl oligopeptidase family serine peptidase [Ktedonosporobacter rubrisoli]QBD80333.1 S9 family peptidase [Ktedonosporobacter rubrisoli]
MNIPATRRGDVVDDYHGTKVADPYRWLEDATSEEVIAWSEAQNALTRQYLADLPGRETLKSRFTELLNYPKYSVPSREGEHYFFSWNTGLQNQAVLYKQKTLKDTASLVLDPNALSADGTVALTSQYYSKDGELLAYSISASGSDQQEIKIRRIVDGSDYAETIKWCKFASIAWRHDNRGFYYDRFPEPGSVPAEDESRFCKVYWHTLGTPQSDDQLIFERPDAKELSFSPSISDDGKYLLLTVWQGTDSNNRFYYRPVVSGDPFTFIRLLDEGDANYTFLGNDGPIFYFRTNQGAPRGRIIAIDTQRPECENWQELVGEQEDVLDFALIVNHQFVTVYMHDAHHVVKLYRLDGSFEGEVALPTLGSIAEVSGKPEQTELFFSFTSFLYPPTIYRYDLIDGSLSRLHEPVIKFKQEDYETTQVFYPTKDGTRVPMFLTHKKGLKLDGQNPVLLYGYGGFDISITPFFDTNALLWLELGGIYAVANLRGGGEYGEDWHQAGMLEKKQNVFDDFIAAAEWLIAERYTSAARLAIIGGSNGGLLTGACLVQRPDLYGTVICQVPVIDMLRYHRFTVGRFWIPEYGDAEHNAEQFAFLYAYSPLHNVKKDIAYPPTLIVTADSDDRVVPAHAKKFTATLQEANSGEHPILLRLEMKAGHGLGKPTSKIIEEESDILAFLCNQLNIEIPASLASPEPQA